MEVHSYWYLRMVFYSKQDSRECHKISLWCLSEGLWFKEIACALSANASSYPLGRLTSRRQRLHLSCMQSSRTLLELAVCFLRPLFLVPVVAKKYQAWTSIPHILERSPKATEQASTSQLSVLLFRLWSQRASQICHVVQMIPDEWKMDLVSSWSQVSLS